MPPDWLLLSASVALRTALYKFEHYYYYYYYYYKRSDRSTSSGPPCILLWGLKWCPDARHWSAVLPNSCTWNPCLLLSLKPRRLISIFVRPPNNCTSSKQPCSPVPISTCYTGKEDIQSSSIVRLLTHSVVGWNISFLMFLFLDISIVFLCLFSCKPWSFFYLGHVKNPLYNTIQYNIRTIRKLAVQNYSVNKWFILLSSYYFLVRHQNDDEVDDISCLHAVLSLQLATASLNCIFRSSKSSLMLSIHFFACLPWLRSPVTWQ